MPSPIRAKTVNLVSLREVETERNLWVTPTFRSAYSLALLEARISKPNLAERAARITMRRTGEVWLWDLDRFEYEESARWSHDGKMVKIQEVGVKR
jgi:hypothetical protein